jgi:hypothetical protein
MKWPLRLLPVAGLLFVFVGWLIVRDAVNAWMWTPSTPPPAAAAPASLEPILKALAAGAGSIEAKLDSALGKIAGLERLLAERAAAKVRADVAAGWSASVRKVRTVTVGRRRGCRPAPGER